MAKPDSQSAITSPRRIGTSPSWKAAGQPAAAWRARWDSLRLFTPARYDSLPGKPFPSDPDSYPGRDEVVEYLTDYAQQFDLPVELSRVRVRHR